MTKLSMETLPDASNVYKALCAHSFTMLMQKTNCLYTECNQLTADHCHPYIVATVQQLLNYIAAYPNHDIKEPCKHHDNHSTL